VFFASLERLKRVIQDHRVVNKIWEGVIARNLVASSPRPLFHRRGYTDSKIQGDFETYWMSGETSHVLGSKRLVLRPLILIFQLNRHVSFKTQLVLFAVRLTSKNNKPKRFFSPDGAMRGISLVRPEALKQGQQKFEAADRSRPERKTLQANVFLTPEKTL